MKFNKIFAVILIFALLSGFVTTGYTSEYGGIELYQIVFHQNEICTINGRVFEGAGEEVKLTTESGTSDVVAGSDGGFLFEVNASFTKYEICIVSESGKKVNVNIDFSGLSGLFDTEKMREYEIDTVTFTHEGVKVEGLHSKAAENIVNLSITDSQNPLDCKNFVQVKADEKGKFILEFKVAEAEYAFNLKAHCFETVSCSVKFPDMTDILTVGENNIDKFITELEAYAEEIGRLCEECRSQNIPTVYEEANLAVIEAFIDNIILESDYGDCFRIGQYNYELTTIYRETVDNLRKYLNFEKTAFDVPRFLTGNIEKDGTSLIATVADTSGQRTQPTFFTGIMSIDYACGEMIPKFSEMGLNATQIGVNPFGFFTDYNPHILNGWYHFEIGEVNSIAEITSEEYTEGSKSLKIVNPDSYKNDNYRRFTNYVKVKPNTTYKWGFKAKGRNINNMWFNPDNRIVKGYKYITSSEEWKSYDYTYTTGDNQTVMELTFGCEDECDEVYIDDVYVKEMDKETNLVVNGGFEDDSPRQKSKIDIEMEEYGWYVNYFGLDKLREILKTAEEHNFIVDIMVPIDLLPACVKKADSTMLESVSQFLPFTLDNDVARSYVKFVALIMAEVAHEYESVHSICLNNEPWVDTNNNSRFNASVTGYYDNMWNEHLKNTYNGSIDALNENYNSKYSSFEEVKMPQKIDSSPLYTDYRSFNESLLNDFFEWYEGEVRPYTEDLDIHIKIMDYFRYNWKDPYVEGGTNYEILHNKFDVNGCDAHSYYGDASTPLQLKMGWYDYMTSLKNVPVYDTESHIVHDRVEITYDEIITDYYGADVWNGAIHGRAVDILWNYDTVPERSALGGSYYANANLAHRPAELAEIAKTSLDLQRLSREITAIEKVEPKVGLIYSWSNLTINENHMSAVAAAYENIIYSGQKVGMITDTVYDDLSKYELIVVPDVMYASDDILQSLKTYMENGGEILLIGDKNLRYDRYGKEITSNIAEYILKNADAKSSVSDKISEMCLSDIVIVDADTGEKTDDIEWSYAKYNDKYVINVLNYGKTRNIKINLNGKNATNIKELRGGNCFEDECITAETYKPILLAVNQVTFDITDKYGNAKKENINILESGMIRYNGRDEGTVVMALYKDEILVDIKIGENIMEIDLSQEGDYRLMATVWDMSAMMPISVSRSIYSKKIK